MKGKVNGEGSNPHTGSRSELEGIGATCSGGETQGIGRGSEDRARPYQESVDTREGCRRALIKKTKKKSNHKIL